MRQFFFAHRLIFNDLRLAHVSHYLRNMNAATKTTKTSEVNMRDALATIIAPVLKLTGFRFSKEYRWGATPWKAFVYRHVNVIAANLKAGL